MESLFDPAPVTPDSKASNPFASPSGIIGTLIMRLLRKLVFGSVLSPAHSYR